MSATLDIDQYLNNGTDEEIASLATKAIDRLWSRRQNGATPRSLLDADRAIAFRVLGVRPAHTLTTREELLAESDRRIQVPFGPFLTEEEFLASLDELYSD